MEGDALTVLRSLEYKEADLSDEGELDDISELFRRPLQFGDSGQSAFQ